MAHVAAWKKEMVNHLKRIMIENPVVAVVSVEGIPGPQMQKMRADLRDHVQMKMTRNTLIKIALEEVSADRPGIDALKNAVDGQIAVVGTKLSPFKLFKEMEATKAPAPAKPGDIAPADIKVEAGETPFPPGPFVGELQKVGIPAAIEGGKIVIKKSKVLVKEGEEIPEDIAKVLPRLEIYPMVVGLYLRAAYEDGVVYTRDVLDIPDDYYPSMLAAAVNNALRLGVSIAYPAPETLPLLLAKAHREALSLAVEAAIPTKESIRLLLARADSHMLALASHMPELQDERLRQRIAASPPPAESVKEEKKEAKPEEEEKEEEVSEEEAAAGLSALFG